MKTLAYSALIATAALAAACSGNGNGTESEIILTDTIAVADSINYAGSTAEVTIYGLYPSGGKQPMTDSIKAWLADCLSWGTMNLNEPLIHVSRQEAADGGKLIEHVNRKLLASAKRDFIYFAGDSIKAGYEYQINFAPSYVTDSLVTYEYDTYAYLGGAHGGSVLRAASFIVPSGVRLTYENAFLPGVRLELAAKVRRGIWQQYFQPSSGEEGAPASLKEALLIDPEAMELPICGPQFGPNGITFTYGQYEIAPYAAGMPSCTLPYSELRALLRPEVIGLLPGSV